MEKYLTHKNEEINTSNRYDTNFIIQYYLI